MALSQADWPISVVRRIVLWRLPQGMSVDSVNLRRSQLVYPVPAQPRWMPNYLDIKLNKQ